MLTEVEMIVAANMIQKIGGPIVVIGFGGGRITINSPSEQHVVYIGNAYGAAEYLDITCGSFANEVRKFMIDYAREIEKK